MGTADFDAGTMAQQALEAWGLPSATCVLVSTSENIVFRVDSDDGRALVLRLPMIADDDLHPEDPRKVGETLWPWKYPDSLIPKMMIAAGRHWNALFQCRPDKQGGNIVKRAWFNYWTKTGDTNLLPDAFDEILTSWDLTFKDVKQSKTGKVDFVVGLVLGRLGPDIYVLDMVRDQLSYLDSKTTVRQTLQIWPKAEVHLIEDKANGPALQSELEDEFDLEMIEPEGDKTERLNMASEDIRGGKVYLPMPHLHPWVRVLIDEVTGFPNAANDDITDALVQAILYWREKPFDVLDLLQVSSHLPLRLFSPSSFLEPQVDSFL